MKFMLFGAVLLASTSAVSAPRAKAPASKAPAKVAPRQAFDFKGIRAGVPIERSLLTDCKTEDGKERCYFKDKKVAGLDSLLAPAVYIHDSKLASMVYVFKNEGTEYLTVLRALATKYGTPCKTETVEWANRAGAKLDNTKTTWCFATGKLVLTQISSRVTYSDLMYTDEVVKQPTKGAVVDF